MKKFHLSFSFLISSLSLILILGCEKEANTSTIRNPKDKTLFDSEDISGFNATGLTNPEEALPPGYEVEESQWPFDNSVAFTVNFDMLPMKIEGIAVSNVTYGSTENGARVFTGSLETYDDQHPLNTCKDSWSSWESPASTYNKMWIESQNQARIILKMRTAMVWEGPGEFDPELGGTDCPDFDEIFEIKPIARENEDNVTPWGDFGEWSEETYYVYPDGVHTRYAKVYTNHAGVTKPFGEERMTPNYVHDFGDIQVWFDSNQSTEPQALGIMDKNAVTLMKMDGACNTFSYHQPFINEGVKNDNFGDFKDANIAIVNFNNTEYTPFLIGRHDDSQFFVPDESLENIEDVFENHDLLEFTDTQGSECGGLWAPIGFMLNSEFYERKFSENYPYVSEIYLRGMVKSSKAKTETYNLAKSWLNAPKLILNNSDFSGGNYRKEERAYYIKNESISTTTLLEFSLQASLERPVIKPSIVIENWGKELASEVTLGNMILEEGIQFRQGLEDNNLVIWFNYCSSDLLQITIR